MTPVIFRYDRDPMPTWDPVFAIFPSIKEDKNNFVQIYQHVGQHSTGDLQACIEMSRPATPQEALPLLNELKSIGYNDLVVIDKISQL